MLAKIYAVKDLKAGIFLQPFQETSDVDATRGFMVACRNKETKIGQFPQDYEVYQVGEFNTESGRLISKETTVFLTSGIMALRLDAEINAQMESIKNARRPDAADVQFLQPSKK